MAKENFPYQLFTVGEKYSRNDINQRLVNSQASQQSGVSSFADSLVLFATLEKEGRPEEIKYKDFFKRESQLLGKSQKLNKEFIGSKKIEKAFEAIEKNTLIPKFQKGEFKFFWESQNPSGNFGTPQKPLLSKLLKGELKGYLFARIEEKTKSKSNRFLYCGSIEPESYDDKAAGKRPFGVKFSCNEIEPKIIKNGLKTLLDWSPKDNSSITEAEELASSCLANDNVKIRKIEEDLRWETLNNIDTTIEILYSKFQKFSLQPSPNLFTKLLEKNSFNDLDILLFQDLSMPDNLMNFIFDLLKETKIKSILDPCMRNGNILYKISEEFETKEIYGFERNNSLFRLSEIFNKNAQLYNDYFPNKKNLDKKFDLIISIPPFNLFDTSIANNLVINGKEIRSYGNGESEVIFCSLNNLSDNGVGVFIVTPNFLITKNNRNIYEFLKSIGFSLEAIFYIPAGVFRPRIGIELRLIIIKKKKSSNFIFEGEISFIKKRDQKLINNFIAFKEDKKDHELGYLKNVKEKDHKSLKEMISFQKLTNSFNKAGLDWTFLFLIVEKITYASEETYNQENSFFVFLNGNNKVFEYALDIGKDKWERGLRNKSIAQVIIDQEKINKKVLIKILESKRGKLAFNTLRSNFTSPARTRISIRNLGGLLIHVPNKSKQDELGEIDQKLLDIKFKLNNFENNLWEKIDQPKESIKELNKIINQKYQKENKDELDLRVLPFPLASILQTVKSFNGIPIKMSLHIEYFFEALSQFLAIYIMSAFYINEEEFNAIWSEVSNFLKERNQNIEVSSFGTWNIIFSLLTKKIVQDIKEEESMKDVWLSRLAIESEEFLDVLTSKKLYGILMRAMKFRNMWRGHTGAIGDDNAKDRYNIYNEMVKEVLNLFGNFWIESPLVIPGESKYKDGKFDYFCRCAMGVTMPLPRNKYSIKQPLEDGMMHIISTVSGESCKLLPLIKFGESPSKDDNACYFYNRRDNDQEQRWISYHNENKPERPFSDPAVNTLLDKLSND